MNCWICGKEVKYKWEHSREHFNWEEFATEEKKRKVYERLKNDNRN